MSGSINKKILQSPNAIFFFLLVGMGLIGILVIGYATVWGPGFIDWDSFNYIAVARSLAAGRGLVYPSDPNTVLPLTNYPPMFPIVLAALKVFNVDAIPAARYLNAILFGLDVVLVGILVKKGTRSIGFALFGALLVMLSSTLVFFYSFALAEGLYLFLTLLGFYLLVNYLDQRKLYLLILASLVIGCAALTRFVGIANAITAILVLLLYRRGSLRNTLVDIAILVALGVGLVAIWMIYSSASLTSLGAPPDSGESLNFEPSGIRRAGWQRIFKVDYMVVFLTMFHNLYSWYFPKAVYVGLEKEHFFLALGLSLLLAMSIALYGKKTKGDTFYLLKLLKNSYPVVVIFASFFVVYYVVILMVTVFLKGVTVDRIFVPALLASLVLIPYLLFFLWRTKTKATQVIASGIAIYLVVFSLFNFVQTVPDIHNKGLGLGRKSIHNSEAMKTLKELVKTKTIYSNYPLMLYLHTGEIGYQISDFTLEKANPGEVIIALFSYESIQTPGFVDKYPGLLKLIQKDDLVEIYSLVQASSSSGAP